MADYKHYIRKDANNIVIGGFSDGFEQPRPGDIHLPGDDFGRHFQINLRTEDRGQWKYKFVNNQMVERTEAELDAEWSEYKSAHPPMETDSEKIARLELEKTALNSRLVNVESAILSLMDLI